MLLVLTLLVCGQLELGHLVTILKVESCPSATAYEETSKTTVNDSSTSVGDTVVTVTSGTGISAGDIVNFGDQYEYRVVSISTNDLTIVRKEEAQYFGFRFFRFTCNINRWCKCKKKMEILRLI